MKSRILRTAIISGILILNIGCDQISKRMVREHVSDFEQISIIENYITLMRVENTGAFLSVGNSLPEPLRFALLSLLPLIIIGFGLGFLFTRSNISKYHALGFAFVIGGGIGNIYDRLVHGSVTDFLHIDLGIFQTGVFNMADVSIMTGVFIVLLNSLAQQRAVNQPES